VEAVLAQKKHKIGSSLVNISVYSPPKSTAASATPSPSSSQQQPKGSLSPTSSESSCAIQVKGLNPKTKRDTIQLYFENKRRSGGGPVKDLLYKEGSGVAMLTFEDAES
jgi:poly [ADP-ribose] polymerase 10/14/15